MGQFAAQPFTTWARAAEWHLGNFTVAWAFTTAKQFVTQLFAALASAVEQCISDFKTRGLAKIV